MTSTNEPVPRVEGGKFKKGHSGNPGGRPSLPEDFRTKVGPRALQRMAQLMESADEAVAERASRWIAERVFGKAPIEISDDGVLATQSVADDFMNFIRSKKSAPKPDASS